MSEHAEEIIVYTDGGSRGNPGPAASGYILKDSKGNRIRAKGLFLGDTTNNVAEYTAVVKALETAKDLSTKKVVVYSDSELLVRQVNGKYKVKSDKIKPLFRQVMSILDQLDDWEVKYIKRERNKDADELVNRALDLARDIEIQPEPTRKSKRIRLGVLISGGGRTLLNILEYIKQGRLNAEVVIVIISRSTVTGVERAKSAGLDVKIIRRKDFTDIDSFSKKLEKELVAAKVDLVIQAGWLCLWKIPKCYINRVMNIHPALLPSFGGKGMWGYHVHEAVLRTGCKVSGCTVHFCNNEYDAGPIIVQRCCEVKNNDTPDGLAARVFEQECIAYPQAIKLFAEGKLVVENGIVKIK